MANDYNVDDILAEVMQKKTKLTQEQEEYFGRGGGSPPPPKEKRTDGAAPFRLAGMTGEFDSPENEKNEETPAAANSYVNSQTRVDIPAQKTGQVILEDSFSTDRKSTRLNSSH